jgi:hypothetical protein
VSENEIVFASRLMVLPGLFILGGFAVMVATIIRNGKVAELRHRERMAMIERGLTPPEPAPGEAGSHHASSFKMTLGIVLCGLGAALFMLIAFAGGAVGIGTGVGGAFVAVGAAFITSAVSAKRDARPGAPGPPLL